MQPVCRHQSLTHMPSQPVLSDPVRETSALPTRKLSPAAQAQLPGARRLHMGHFAFMRAVVQGLDTRDSWNRYLRMEGEHDDIRNVRRTIQWIRDEFAAAARRSERHGIARLIQIDANVIDDKAEKIPSLEDFAAEHGLEDFSQAEQIEHYQSRYGNVQPNQSRRRRLIVRQLEAIRWLEELAVQPPQPDDPIVTWLNPDLAAHLEKSGIKTLRQLADRINGIGYRWAASVRAVGQGKAERIVSWLRAHEATLGLSIGEHVLKRRNALQPTELAEIVAPTTAIVPLEKLIIPAALDGRNGCNRSPQAECRITADHDLAAVHAWIEAKGSAANQKERHEQAAEIHDADSVDTPDSKSVPLTHTQRAYLKEAERFLLWAVVQRKTSLSSMTAEDCEAGTWVDDCAEAFLAGYAEVVPGSIDRDAPLFVALWLDKALYEVIYELRNRPDWLSIPVNASRRLLGSTGSGVAAEAAAEGIKMTGSARIDRPGAPLPVDGETLARVGTGEHHAPHSVLGAHLDDHGHVTVRTVKHLAEAVSVVTSEGSVPMAHESGGVWVAVLEPLERGHVPDYRINWGIENW